MNNKLRDLTTAKERRIFLEKDLTIDLPSISNFSFTEQQVQNKNIENLIGAVQIPLGIAGPLKVNGKYTNKEYYLPLATTEGALVASVARGAKAVSQSGGVYTLVENIGVTRGPVFRAKNLKMADEFKTWLNNNFFKLKEVSEKTSSHLTLLKQEIQITGKLIYVRFYFDTKDAMGMNMATIATAAIVQFIENEFTVTCASIAGNFDIDKKPSWLNFLQGRGKKVNAEVLIPEKICLEVLKTTPAKIHEVCQKKCLIGSIMSGSLGFNSHFANIVAAIFAATGQDLAHISEGCLGLTTTEVDSGDLYFCVYLPDLLIGTIGGGTGLPAQKESLSILGIPDQKLNEGEQVLKFAEIIGGAVLAGELSLLAALASKQLAQAHERLGRGRK